MQVYYTKKLVYKNAIKYIEFKDGLKVYEKGDKYDNSDIEICDHRTKVKQFYKDTGRVFVKYESVIQRAKQTVFDIVASNDFDYFCTFTFRPDPEIDRYSFSDTSRAIRKYLRISNIKKYVLVYEQHKDGAYHYHALANIPEKHLKHHHHRIYNITNYKYGFTTAKKIIHDENSNIRLAGYLVKYMTKQFYTYLETTERQALSNTIVQSGHDTKTKKILKNENPKKNSTNQIYRGGISSYQEAGKIPPLPVSPNAENIFKNKKLYWCSRFLNRPNVQYNVPVDKTAKWAFENKHVRVTIKLLT